MKRKFFKFLLPSVSAMWVFSIYTMVDGMFVGKGVGPTALAAVNISMPFINIVFGISLLMSIGASTMVSMSMGKGDFKRASRLFTMSSMILCGTGLLITAISVGRLEGIATFLGADSVTMDYVKDYLGIIIPFCSFFMVAYYLEVLVKADGFPRYAILFVSVAAITNLALDYVFIMKFGWGVRGAAWATGISQLISCIGFMAHFVMGRSNMKLTRPVFDMGDILAMVSTGFPEAVTEFSTGIMVYFFNFSILRHIGEDGVAAFGVMMYANSLVVMSMIGINQAMQPLVSFFCGRRDSESVKGILRLSFKSVAAASILFALISQVFAGEIVELFISRSDSHIYELSKGAFRIFSASFLICGFNIIISGYFTATRQVKRALLISSVRGIALVAIFVTLLPMAFGEFGIWISLFVSEIVALGISAWMLSRSMMPADSVQRDAKSTKTA
ncbi:MATE family efflux transporter [Peptoclostridium litorale]|nr:MATE family efflux transporter [Peptoclostridium litorale]